MDEFDRDIYRLGLAIFNAAEYDTERATPASSEAHAIWNSILDKPHFALPTIQHLLDQRDKK